MFAVGHLARVTVARARQPDPVQGRVIASGPPSEIRTNAEVERAYLGDSGTDHE